LFLAFGSLASAPNTDIKVFATALGAGILLDATIVRALLVPAAVAMFGRWNWWLPGPLARTLRSRSPAAIQLPAPTRQPAGDDVFAGARVRLPEGDPTPPER
jgi:RND superfamily putative drug exporter